MTGRRLYDLYCDAHKAEAWPKEVRVAWPYLGYYEKRMWGAMARRIKGVKR